MFYDFFLIFNIQMRDYFLQSFSDVYFKFYFLGATTHHILIYHLWKCHLGKYLVTYLLFVVKTSLDETYLLHPIHLEILR